MAMAVELLLLTAVLGRILMLKVPRQVPVKAASACAKPCTTA
jgi:hypothetical protein